jgi:hypothetical protein
VTPREQEEYRALRATIRQRGTARVWVFSAGMAAWAALTFAALALALPPVATLVPLLVLAAAYEAVLALHVGVERVGRYLHVFYEDRWEGAASSFGRPSGSLGLDPLFRVPFLLAALLTALPVVPARPIVQELVVVLASIAAFTVRVLTTSSAARKQRDVDTARFLELKRR